MIWIDTGRKSRRSRPTIGVRYGFVDSTNGINEAFELRPACISGISVSSCPSNEAGVHTTCCNRILLYVDFGVSVAFWGKKPRNETSIESKKNFRCRNTAFHLDKDTFLGRKGALCSRTTACGPTLLPNSKDLFQNVNYVPGSCFGNGSIRRPQFRVCSPSEWAAAG